MNARSALQNPVVLVTGSTGFIGRHLVDALLRRGAEVRVLARPGTRRMDLPAGVEVVAARLEPREVAQVAQGATVVYHLAGLTRASSEAEFMVANALGTHAVAMGARAAGARFVLVSSLAAGGPGTLEQPRSEDDVDAPITPYGRSKLAGERHVRGLAELDWVVVRPSGVYGPGDRDFLAAFRAAKRGFFPVIGDPNRAYSLVHVTDLVQMILAAGDSAQANGRLYYAAHPHPLAWRDVLEGIAQAMGRKPSPLRLPNALLWAAALGGESARIFGKVGLINLSRARDLTARGWVCSAERLERELGVRALIDHERGLFETARWYEERGWI